MNYLQRSIELKDGTQLASATQGQFDYSVHTYDDSLGPLWICGEEFGPSWIIRAQSYESAYDIWTDERPTISAEDIPEAYGFYGEQGAEKLKSATLEAVISGDEQPELIEGYTYQSNFTGTGIVATGHYEWLHELTPEFIKRWNIRLTVETY